MKLAIRTALGAVFACALLPAHAAATFNASFQATTIPLLRTGTGIDGPAMLNGQWGQMYNEAESHVREIYGTTVDPDSGLEVPAWRFAHSENRDRAPNLLNFGEAHSFIYGPNDWIQTTASSGVNFNTLGASAQLRDLPGEAQSWAAWNRDFWLEAGTTITFSGIASLGITGDVPSLDAVASLLGGDGQSFATLTYADAHGRARVGIGATLSDFATGRSDVFDYTLGPDGLLSLTITNTGTERLYGNLFAGSYIDTTATSVAAPVPEPAAWLLMLGGAALVGGIARRRAPAPTLAAA